MAKGWPGQAISPAAVNRPGVVDVELVTASHAALVLLARLRCASWLPMSLAVVRPATRRDSDTRCTRRPQV